MSWWEGLGGPGTATDCRVQHATQRKSHDTKLYLKKTKLGEAEFAECIFLEFRTPLWLSPLQARSRAG